MKDLEQLINEAVQDSINEAVVLGSETKNLEYIANALRNIYNRIIQRGASRNEVSVSKIAKIIQDLSLISRQWQNKTMW